MKNQSTVPKIYNVSLVMLGWLSAQLQKLSNRSIREKEGSFAIFKVLGGVALFPSKPDSKYIEAAEKLVDAAIRGKEIVLKLPPIENSKSQHLGQPGEKLSLDVELYEVIKFNGNFGLTFIHKIRDVDGNELVWFSQGKRIDEGIYHLTAKVHTKPEKAHTEYYGTQQTRVTHCKFEPRRLVNGDSGRDGLSNAGKK